MLGRAIYGNPWLFLKKNNPEDTRGTGTTYVPSREERITALIEHLRYFNELLIETTNFAVMKKHFKAYINGWPDAKELRIRLMETQTVPEAIEILSAAL